MILFIFFDHKHICYMCSDWLDMFVFIILIGQNTSVSFDLIGWTHLLQVLWLVRYYFYEYNISISWAFVYEVFWLVGHIFNLVIQVVEHFDIVQFNCDTEKISVTQLILYLIFTFAIELYCERV